MMNGGYFIVSKTDTNLYEKLNKALTLGKPVLWYEDDNTCYYIDTITKSGTDIILTKGGKTITIENDGDITESGDVQNPTLETIVDKNGNKRFIEVNGIDTTPSGVELLYSKASLSGTHLMVVLACKIDNATALTTDDIAIAYTLPSYVIDKIVPVTPNRDRLEIKNVLLYSDDGETNQNVDFGLYLSRLDRQLIVYINGTITTTADRYFRVQFDLLIDNE